MHWSESLDKLARSYHDDKEGPDADLTRKVGRATVSTVAGAATTNATGSHGAGVAASKFAKSAISDDAAHFVGSEARAIGTPLLVVASLPILAVWELGKWGLKKLSK